MYTALFAASTGAVGNTARTSRSVLPGLARRAAVLGEEPCDFILTDLALRHAENQFDKLILAEGWLEVVQQQESNCRIRTRALIAVDKRVVLRDVKKIRCSHRHDRRVQVFAIESSLWHRDCGLQGARVTNSVGTAIPLDLLFMNFEYFVQREEQGIHSRRGDRYSANRLKARP